MTIATMLALLVVTRITSSSTPPAVRLVDEPELIPNFESYMTARFDRTPGEAAVDLNLARRRMVMDRKNKKPNLPTTYYSIHVQGNNYGNIQQGGESNNRHTQ